MSKIYKALKMAEQAQGGGNVKQTIQLPRVKGRAPQRFVEVYSRLSQAINRLRPRDAGGVLLVVSSVAAEGVSTVSRNLALSLASSSQDRITLVDANLRTPSQHRAFNVDRNNGLSEVAAGRLELARAVPLGSGVNFGMLPCGRAVTNPAEFMTASRLRSTMNSLRNLSALTIIDGPPVTLYPEACELARLADGVILVVRAESTRWEVAKQAKRLLLQSDVQILGAILNERRYYIPRWIYRFV
jgi:capsular exopolysaccharide synthesis family protein